MKILFSLHLLDAFYTRTAGVRRRTDESDFIAEIIGLKGGEALYLFKMSQLRIKNFCTV